MKWCGKMEIKYTWLKEIYHFLEWAVSPKKPLPVSSVDPSVVPMGMAPGLDWDVSHNTDWASPVWSLPINFWDEELLFHSCSESLETVCPWMCVCMHSLHASLTQAAVLTWGTSCKYHTLDHPLNLKFIILTGSVLFSRLCENIFQFLHIFFLSQICCK